MFRTMLLSGLLLGILSPLFAQHPFYQQIMQDGKSAMEQENWELASRYYEIAAFGLMEDEASLVDIYIRQVIIQTRLDNDEQRFQYISYANRILAENAERPPQVPVSVWNEFLVITKKKDPPIPREAGALRNYLRDFPDNKRAHIALIDALISQGDNSGVRQAITRGLTAFDDDPEILGRALNFSLTKDRDRNADEYAPPLLAQFPDHDLANEYMGNIAVKDRQFERAANYFAKVSDPILPRTNASMTRLKDYQDKQADARKKEQERKAQAQKEDDRKKEKAEADARAREGRERKDREAKAEKARKDKEERDRKAQQRAEQEAARKARNTKPKPATSKPEAEKETTPKPATTKPADSTKTKTAKQRLKELEQRAKAKPRDLDLQFELVNTYLENKDLRKSRRKLNDLEKSVNDPRYIQAFAHYYYLKGLYTNNVDKLKNFKPEELTEKARYYLGMSHFQLNDFKSAQTMLDSLDQDKFPILKRTFQIIANESSDKDDNEPKPEASLDPDLTRINGLAAKHARDGLILTESVELINLYLDRDNWRQARRLINGLNDSEPTHPDTRYFKARLLLKDRKYKDASDTFYQLVNYNNYRKGEVFYYGGLAAHYNRKESIANYMWDRALRNGTRFEEEIRKLKQGASQQSDENPDGASEPIEERRLPFF